MSEDLEKKRAILERSANRTRERLMDTITALAQRRHEITDVKGQLREHAAPIAIAGGAIVIALGTALGLSIYHFATRRERLRKERWTALRRIWNHPERLAQREHPKGSFASEVGRKVAFSVLTYVALELTKRTVRRALMPAEPALEPKVFVRTLPA